MPTSAEVPTLSAYNPTTDARRREAALVAACEAERRERMCQVVTLIASGMTIDDAVEEVTAPIVDWDHDGFDAVMTVDTVAPDEVDFLREQAYRWEASRHRARRLDRARRGRVVRMRPQRSRSSAPQRRTSSTARRSAASSTTDPSGSSASRSPDRLGVARPCARLVRAHLSAVMAELLSGARVLRWRRPDAAPLAWEVIA